MSLNVSKENAFKFFDAKIKSYGNGEFLVKEYDRTLRKKKPGLEKPGKDHSPPTKQPIKKAASEVKEVRTDSLSRTRNRLIDLSITNQHEWKSFITLTFADNVTNVTEANRIFANWVRQMRRACQKEGFEFKYMGVPEFQKRGAVHYHLFTNLTPGKSLLKLQEYRHKKMYDASYWTHGFTSAFDIALTDDQFNVGLYITKYLYKDMDDRLYGRNKILKSNNLLNPIEYDYLQTDEKYIQALEYILDNAYDSNTKKIVPNEDVPYAVGFTQHNFKTSLD